MIQGHVEAVNRDLSKEGEVAGAQIKRFLVLHKELDADDGELTRTAKVRRGTRHGALQAADRCTLRTADRPDRTSGQK